MPARRPDDLPDDPIASSGGRRIPFEPPAADPLAVVGRDQGESGSDRDADQPGERDPTLRVRVVEEQEDRADQRAGGEDGVLERAEPEHPHARLLGRDAEILEGLDVHCEPAARDEHPEPGGDDRSRPQSTELDAAAHVSDLAVRERVADVRGDRARHGERDPVPVRVPEMRRDGAVPRRAGDEDRGDQRDRGGEDHEHDDVVRLLLAVVGEQHLERSAPANAPARHRSLCTHMRPGGFEPPTRGLEVRRSVH